MTGAKRPLDWHKVSLRGRQLIEASAGTGKTYTITTLVLRLLLEQRVSVDQLLVVTFTNAATAELRDRIRGRLRRAIAALEAGADPEDTQVNALVQRSQNRAADRNHLLEALRSMDEAAIYTIHGFCQRVLQEHAFESGVRFEMELATDARPMLTELAQDFWSQLTYSASEARVRFLERRAPIRHLARLAYLATRSPDMPVEPAPPACDPDTAVHDYLICRSAVARLWLEVRGDIERLLDESIALNRQRYRRSSIPGWIEQLDKLLTSQSESLNGMFPEFERFLPSTLRSATKKGHQPVEHPFFDACVELQEAYERAESELGAWLLEVEHRLIEFAREELARRKEQRGIQTFDDLLLQLERAIRGDGGRELADHVFTRYPYALIDEFQDTDPDQYAIFDAIYSDGDRRPRGALFMIGDPKQAIYAFRGADVFAYLKAVQDSSGSAWTLDTSYRTDPALLHGINQVFLRPTKPFEIDAIEYHEVQPKPNARDRLSWPGRAPLSLMFVGGEERSGYRDSVILKRTASAAVHDLVAREVVALLESRATIEGRRVEPGDIAILTRKNREAALLQQALTAVGVPAVLQGDASVFDAPEAVEIARLLLALAEPANATALRSALTTSILGVDANELDRLGRDELEWEEWVERFFAWHELWVRRGFVQAFRAVLREREVVPRLLSQLRGERRLTNVLHLVELLHEATTKQHLGVAGLLRWFDQVRHDPGARDQLAPESAQVRLESDAHAVQLTTMHKSKGLEYPVVFCPFLWDGNLLWEQSMLQYHDPDDGYRLKLDLAPSAERPEARQHAQREALAEALRLAYVAMTRAKHRLVIVCGKFRSYGGSSLAHLLHDPSFVPGLPAHSASERVQHAKDDELIADLEQLAAAANRDRVGQAVEVVQVEETAARRYQPRGAPPQRLAHREPRRTIDHRWRAASFSAMTAEAVSAPAADGLDHDEATSLALGSAAGPSAPDSSSELPVPLHEFPRGPAPGNVLHAVLRDIDFTSDDAGALRTLCSQMLTRYGLFTEQNVELLAVGVRDVIDTPIVLASRSCDEVGSGGAALVAADGPIRLRDVPLNQRFSEMEFTLPVAITTNARERRYALTPKRLAAVFSQHGGDQVPKNYAARVGALHFDALLGYLRGFIDLVFVVEGRWYVADYKSNHLGAFAGDYAPERIVDAVAEHHYLLQGYLYTAALHRYLTLRLPGYHYESHFGGLFHLFARGMSPQRGPATGVLAGRPTLALINGLLDALDGKEAARVA